MRATMQDFPLTVRHLLWRAERLFPRKLLVTRTESGNTHTSFGEMAVRARKAAAAFTRLGVKRGDAVGVLAWSNARYVELYYAVPCMGAVLHTLNIRLFPDQLQHVIADGLSMVFLVRDLLRWIEDPDAELPVLNAPASADDVLPRTVRRRVSTSPTRFQLVLALATLYSRVRRALISGRRPQTPARHVLRHRTWVLTAEQTTALRARCRREGVSMHAAICTAFLSAFPAVHTPVSLRSFLARPVGESVGLFVGAAEVKLAYHDALGFWTNARRFRRKLRRQLHDPFGIFRLFSKAVPVELVQRMGPLIVELTSGGRPFGITNLGDLDAAALGLGQGRLKIEGFFGAVMGIVDASVVTACTLGGRLRLHLLATELESHETAIRDDCERAVRRLLAAIDG